MFLFPFPFWRQPVILKLEAVGHLSVDFFLLFFLSFFFFKPISQFDVLKWLVTSNVEDLRIRKQFTFIYTYQYINKSQKPFHYYYI